MMSKKNRGFIWKSITAFLLGFLIVFSDLSGAWVGRSSADELDLVCEHNYVVDRIVWSQNGDGYMCTVYVKCARCSDPYPDPFSTTVISEVKFPATCYSHSYSLCTAYFIDEYELDIINGYEIEEKMNEGTTLEPHTYNETPAWSWADDYSQATATFTCQNKGCTDQVQGHSVKVEAAITDNGAVATCAGSVDKIYTATVQFNGQTYTDTKTETLNPVAHTYNTAPVWNWTGYDKATATFTCTGCTDQVQGHSVKVEAAITDNGAAASCAGSVDKVYTATAQFNGQTYTDRKTETLNPADHSYGNAVKENEAAATCQAEGSYDSVVYCSKCGKELSRTKKVIAKKDHTEETIPGSAATCTETGLTEGVKCSVCGAMLKDQEVINATGHAYTAWETMTAATADSSGIERRICIVCGFQETREIPPLATRRTHSPMNPVESIDENTTELHLVKGQKFTLSESGWISSNKKNPTISKKNVLTAKKESSSPVKITKGDRSIDVYITKPAMAKRSITLEAGSSEAIIFNYDDAHLEVQWYSSAPDIATISDDGIVTAVAKGTTKITAYVNGSAYSCNVKVTEDNAAEDRTLHITLGNKKKITIKGVKKDAAWVSDDEAIASVAKQTIRAEGAGETVVKTEYNGKEYRIHVYVEDLTITTKNIQNERKNRYKLNLAPDESTTIEFAAIDQPVLFKSSNSEVAYVDADGTIHANKPGNAKLTAKINGNTIIIRVKIS